MDLGLVGFALAAGALASVNPCGCVMLPALVAVQLQGAGGMSGAGRGEVVLRALGFGLRATLGFVLVFGVVGAVVSVGARSIVRYFPYGGLAIGVALLGIGLWALLGRRSLPLTGLARPAFGRRPSGALAFGAAYAVTSLSCTLPVFLAVVGGTLFAEGIAAALAPFAGYAAGMGGVLLAVTLATALSAGALVRWLRVAMPFVEPAGALLLTLIGTYLVVYWLPRLGAFGPLTACGRIPRTE
jgi:cytochrome c biogenesis protein CcdA